MNALVCGNCKLNLPIDAEYCSECGVMVRFLTIKRKVQYSGFLSSMKITVNGYSLGKLPVGSILKTRVASDVATIEVPILLCEPTRIVLRLGCNPLVTFGFDPWWGGHMVTVHDADVLDQRGKIKIDVESGASRPNSNYKPKKTNEENV